MSDTPIYDQLMREATAGNPDAHTLLAEARVMCA